MSALSFAILIGWITLASTTGILEFGFSFLSLLSFALSPICLVVGIIIFICLAVIDKLSVSAEKPDGLGMLEKASMKPSPSDDIFPWISAENPPLPQIEAPAGAYPRRELAPCGSRGRLFGPCIYSGDSPICQYG